jgi:hypothetical protein
MLSNPFIKRLHLRATLWGFSISATRNDRVLEKVGDGLEADGDSASERGSTPAIAAKILGQASLGRVVTRYIS